MSIIPQRKIKDPISRLCLDTNLFINMDYERQVNIPQSIMQHIKRIKQLGDLWEKL